jgi:GNAT superfamily N-acetyltransferase
VHIKHADIKDLSGITDCARRFFEYAQFDKQGLTLDVGSFEEMIGEHIKSQNGIVILMMDGDYVAGGIAGMVQEWGFNKSIKLAVELFYWVDEKYRGRNSLKLLILYEEYAKALGALNSMMVSVNTHLQDKVGKLYKKMGYTEYERFYIKNL